MTHPTLQMGDRGEAALTLTRLLQERGHLAVRSRTFNRAVRMAVREFQARHIDERGHPLVPDGIVGPLTWWALEHPNNEGILTQPVAAKFRALPEAGGSPKGREALAAAIREMEAGAEEVGQNNAGPWVEKYLNGIVPAPANWCAGFVSWCFAQHRDGIPFRYSLGARDIRDQFRRRGWLYNVDEDSLPQAGDIVVWWRDQPNGWKGHIGLVHHCSNGIAYTIEGNKGGYPAPVRPFDYVLGRIQRLLGFGRVP